MLKQSKCFCDVTGFMIEIFKIKNNETILIKLTFFVINLVSDRCFCD